MVQWLPANQHSQVQNHRRNGVHITDIMKNYVEIAKQYANDIINDRIVSNKWTKLACERFVRDLKNESLPFYINEDKAAHVCFFMENLKHYQGPKANQDLFLEPWQVFVLVNLFGWLHKDGPKKGKRRFRKSYVELGRGNGKSFLASGLALYMLAADGEEGSEVYSAATTREQARIVFDDARHVAFKMPAGLASRIGISVHAHSITAKKASRFKPLSAEAGSLDGLKIHFAVVDELHAHKTREVWDVLLTGLGKRDQSMIFAITTAGFDLSGIGYEVHNYVKKILERSVNDDTQFGIIYAIDDDDEWQNESTWIKANPNWKVSVDPEYFHSLAAEAISTPSKQVNFKTKNLDLWLSSSNSFFDIQAWEKCVDKTIKLEDFKGKDCWIGIDLATRSDMAALALVFRKNKKFYIFPKYYLPEAAIIDGRNSQYRGWEIERRIQTTPGNVLDLTIIENEIIELTKQFNVKSINLDPHEARMLVTSLQTKIRTEIIEIPQTAMNLSDPTKELDAMSRSGDIVFNCPILLWMASNVVCRIDTNDNVKPNKERPQDKIDGIIATVCALATMINEPDVPAIDWSMFGFVNRNGLTSFSNVKAS
jgi:phage terminase large subunit-like protein